MHGLILAAGRGKRLGDLTKSSPKGMVKLKDMSLIEWQINAMQMAGVEKITIVTGYMSEKLDYLGLDLLPNHEWDNSEIVHSLICADEILRDKTCIISYSDIIFSSRTVEKLILETAEFAISYDPNWLDLWTARFSNPLEDAESFKKDKNNHLIEIGKRCDSAHEIEGQYMGLLKSTPKAWKKVQQFIQTLVPQDVKQLQITQLLNHLIVSNTLQVKVVEVSGNWMEIDSIKDLELAQRLFGEN